MRGLLVNDIPKYLVISLWLGTNALIFGVTFQSYSTDRRYFYTRILLGHALAIARSAAACLNFNCMLILLPVCRNMLSYVRGWLECCPRRARRILDKNITFHKLCAYMITVLTLVHYYGHSANVRRFATAQTEPELDYQTGSEEDRLRVSLIVKLANLGKNKGETYLSPIRQPIYPTGAIFAMTGGWTGFVMALCLLLMFTSSTELIRRSYFELFWYVHHLFIVFFGLLFFHGTGSQIRRQTNVAEHNPEHCSTVDPIFWSTDAKCSTTPQFEGLAPSAWIWIIVPTILYVCERFLRLLRYMQPVELLNIIKHPSNVIEIQMRKKEFKANVGQYIFIQCPAVSHFEWHPFTLTSAPEEDYFSVHIRIVGDWTSSLYYAIGADEYGVVHPSWKMPRLAVDGPFGTASEGIFDYDVVLCVGSGIGVTPFASLLKSVYYRTVNNTNSKLTKVYFFWICREMHAFEWFGDMLLHLENRLAEAGRRDLIEYHIYLTRGWTPSQARAIALSDEGERDVITGLEQKTNFGRPNWDDVFLRIASQHVGADIGVFFCGVAALSTELHKMCNKHSSSSTAFHYNKENF